MIAKATYKLIRTKIQKN